MSQKYDRITDGAVMEAYSLIIQVVTLSGFHCKSKRRRLLLRVFFLFHSLDKMKSPKIRNEYITLNLRLSPCTLTCFKTPSGLKAYPNLEAKVLSAAPSESILISP